MSNCEGNVYHIGMGCCVPKIANPDLYYTKEEVDEKIDDIEVSGVTEERAEEMIDESLQGYATEEFVSEFTYDKSTIEDMIEEGGGFIPENYYDKTATDALLAKKADTATTYTKDDIDIFIDTLETADSVLDGKVNRLATNLETETQRAQNAEAAISGAIPSLDDYATKDWVSGYTYDKQTIEDMIEEGGGFIPENYYDKTATDALLANKANTATTYTKTEVNNAISAATSEKADSSTVNSLSGYVDSINDNVETVSGDVSDIEDTLDTYFKESAKVSDFDYTTNDDYIELHFPYYKNQGDGWDNENKLVQIEAATESSAGVMSADDKTKLNGLLKTWSGTQAEYDAITEKDDNTVYFIKED